MLAGALNQLRVHPNPDDMHDVLIDIANAFMDRDESEVDADEKRLFGDFIATALDRLGDEMKALVADTVCDSALVTPDMVAQLVRHESDAVAEAFLEFSPSLGDKELVALAESEPENRQMAIARRDYISAIVSSVLITHGTDRVLVTLSNNKTAEFSNIGLTQLLKRVGDNPLVQASFVSRSMQQKNFGQSVFAAVDAQLRERLGSFLELIDANAYRVIAQSAASGIAQKASDEFHSRMTRQTVLTKVREGTLAFDNAFVGFCLAERPQDCIWALAERLRLPERLVQANFTRVESDRIAILCRAAGLSDATYAVFSKMRLVAIGQTPETIGSLVREYAGVDFDQARRAVGIVRLRAGEEVAGASAELSTNTGTDGYAPLPA